MCDILTIEMGEEDVPKTCQCCGQKSRSIHGFVYRNDDAYAIYYAGWSEGHPRRGITTAIAVGEWGDESDASDRVSIGILVRSSQSEIQFTVLDPEESPWSKTDLLGEMVPRGKAMKNPILRDVFEVAECVVRNDSRVKSFLDQISQ